MNIFEHYHSLKTMLNNDQNQDELKQKTEELYFFNSNGANVREKTKETPTNGAKVQKIVQNELN